jgi:hypothetical protein
MVVEEEAKLSESGGDFGISQALSGMVKAMAAILHDDELMGNTMAG